MNKTWKVAILAVLVAAVVIVVFVKRADRRSVPMTHPATSASSAPASQTSGEPAALPRLVDLGSRGCIPCDMMAPILDQLRKDFAGRLEVTFYDVRERPDIGRNFGIRVIPTQIFFDAQGRELFRHEGFISRPDILGEWKELGVDLQGPTQQTRPGG